MPVRALKSDSQRMVGTQSRGYQSGGRIVSGCAPMLMPRNRLVLTWRGDSAIASKWHPSPFDRSTNRAATGLTLISRRDVKELFRDCAADQFERHAGSAWAGVPPL